MPTTRNDVRIFKNISTSIYRNLPYPSVTAKHNHAYVSIREIISDALARGIDLSVQIEDDLHKHVEKSYEMVGRLQTNYWDKDQ